MFCCSYVSWMSNKKDRDFKMEIKKIFNDKDLLLFSFFSFFFATATLILALIQFRNHQISLGIVSLLVSIAFDFVAIFVFFKWRITKREHEVEIKEISKYDTLTGLPNAYSFIDFITEKILEQKVKQNRSDLYLITISIERFKFINETFGYFNADNIIVSVKNELLGVMDEHDILGRLNNDEFGILTNKKKINIDKYVSELEDVFGREYNILNSDSGVFVSAKMGIAKVDFTELPAYDAEVAIKKSGMALEYSKKENVAAYLYNNTLENENNNIIRMEKDLRNAISNGEIDVFFQPKICLKTGKMVGAEALARWFSKSRNSFIRPDIFIDLAEDIGIIEDIGDFVLKRSASELHKWHDLGYKDLKVAVNVSTKQFTEKLPVFIKETINQTKLKPEDLEIEVTESALVNDKNNGIDLLQKINNSGVVIAIDDFGTGYSSLSYLVEFPLDVVKIDKSFIDKILEKDETLNKKGKAVISTFIHLSHKIGCKVVAEGVEQKEQADFLKAEGCDYIQGYYYSKPLNSEDIVKYIENKNG